MDHSKDRFLNKSSSSSHPFSNDKDKPDDIKDDEEDDADAVVKDEIMVKEEGEEDTVAAPGSGEDAEAMEDGAGDGKREDDVLPDFLKKEVEDAV